MKTPDNALRDVAHEAWIAGALAATLPGQVSFSEWWDKRTEHAAAVEAETP